MSKTLAYIQTVIKKHPAFVVLCAVFVALVVTLGCTWFKYYIYPDSTSYVTIAQKYAHLDFRHAINGYWGPLISWLLVPFIWLHVSLTFAGSLLSAMTCVVILAIAYRFLIDRGATKRLATAVAAVIAVLLVSWTVSGPLTPDLLITLFILMFAVRLNQFIAEPSRRNAVILGLTGALMYFSKGFGFYLFLAVVGIVILWQLWQSRNLKTIVMRWLAVGIVFGVVVLPFIGLISVKYHKLTINNAGMYDHNIFGPVAKGAQPMVYTGPIAPPNKSAASVWEDPTPMIYMVPGWNPLSTKQHMQFFLNDTLGHNLNLSYGIIIGLGPVVAFGLLMLVVNSLQRTYYQREFVLFSCIALVIPVGYAVVLTEPRYLWPTAVLAVTGLGLWFVRVEKKKILTGLQVAAGGALLVAVFLYPVGQQIIASHTGEAKDWQLAHQKSVAIGNVLPKDSNVIADTFSSYYECYVAHLHCFATLAPPPTSQPAERQAYYQRIKQDGITYYIDFHTRNEDANLQDFVRAHYTQIHYQKFGTAELTIYKLR